MKTIVCLSVLTFLVATQADFDAPVYELHLDERPKERWKVMMLEQIDRHGWEYTYGPVLSFINDIFPSEIWAKYDKDIRRVVEPILGEEAVLEISGIVETAAEIGENVTMSELECFQLFYELLMECTGIVAQDENGNVIHGRNMDMGLPVTNLTAQVEWKVGGRTVITSTQYLGYLGIHTGMRMGGWSVQANERVVLEPGPGIGYEQSILLLTVNAFLEGHKPVGQFLRESLLSARTFEDALPLLSTIKIASPLYLIVGGLQDGAVITRDRMGLARSSQDTSIYGQQRIPPGATLRQISDTEDWWEVQTNWDPWVNQTHSECEERMSAWSTQKLEECAEYIRIVYGDSNDCTDLCQLYSDGRSEDGKAGMTALGPQNRTSSDLVQSLFAVLSHPPVLNDGTKFSSIMSAGKGVYSTVVREPSERGQKDGVVEKLRFFVRHLTHIDGL